MNARIFGNNLKRVLSFRKISQAELARKAGIKPSVISGWIQGRFEPKRARLLAVAKALNIPASVLLGKSEDIDFYLDIPTYDGPQPSLEEMFGELDPDNSSNDDTVSLSTPPYRRPVLGVVQAGIPITAIENYIDWEDLDPREYTNPEEYFGLKIKGDSMSPRILDGDVVIVHQQAFVESGDIAIVLVNGEDATCKKVIYKDRGIILNSFNPTFEPMFYTDEEIEKLPVTIVGKVVELRGKF